MSVIYRKYRPLSFSEVLGQDHVVELLREAIRSKKTSHAYLFSGPRGTGKTTMARLLAKAVTCKNFFQNDDVCNSCEACTEINAGSALDVIEMDAASNRGIEEIRSLRDGVNFSPSQLDKKIYIIDEAHMLTKDAFNALLKTLEEPPSHVLFILATTEPHKLPITILSRVQRFDFRLVEKSKLTEKLNKIFTHEGVDVEDEVYDLVFRHSGGSFRDAESLIGKIISSNKKEKLTKEYVLNLLGLISEEIVVAFVQSLIKGNIWEALNVVDKIYIDGQDISIFIDQVLDYLQTELIEGNYAKNDVVKIIKCLVNAKSEMAFLNDKLLPLRVAIFEIGEAFSRNSIKKKAEKGRITNDLKGSATKEGNEVDSGISDASTPPKNSKSEILSERTDFMNVLLRSDLPILIKTQLRAVEIEQQNDKISLLCENEIAEYLDKESKRKLIEKVLRRYGIKQVAIKKKNDIMSGLDNEVKTDDNSDIVEELDL
jgi:DNA polymerase-3 subunit gamma/tau